MVGMTPFQRSQQEIRNRFRDKIDGASIGGGGASYLGPATGGGGASGAVDIMSQFSGKHISTDGSAINAAIKAGGVDLDAASAAWCAAFVNASLARVGIKGSGNQTASSFLNWGGAVSAKDLIKGDVAVVDRGVAAGAMGDHVGLATGKTQVGPDGTIKIEIISGNSGGVRGDRGVTSAWYGEDELKLRRARGGGAPGAANDNEGAVASTSRGDKINEQDTYLAKDLAERQVGPLEAANAEIRSQNALLDAQKASLFGSTQAVAAAAKAQELKNIYDRDGVTITPQLKAKIDETAASYGELAKRTEDFNKMQQDSIHAMDEVRGAARDGLGTFIGDLIKGKSAGDALKDTLSQLGQKLMNMGLDSLTNSLFGKSGTAGGGIFGSLLGSLFGGGAGGAVAGAPLNLHAAGTDSAPGGLSIVGEKGPEIMNVPRGAQIFSNAASLRMTQGQPANQNNISIGGHTIIVQGNADTQSLDRMRAELDARDAKITTTLQRNMGSMQSAYGKRYG